MNWQPPEKMITDYIDLATAGIITAADERDAALARLSEVEAERDAATQRANMFQRVVEAAMEWRSHSASAGLPDADDQALIRAVDIFRGDAADATGGTDA